MKLRIVIGIFAISFSVFFTYQNALDGRFHYDDYHSILYNPHIRNLQLIPSYFIDATMFSVDADKAMYRPMLLVSYAVNYALGGYDPKGYLIVNIVVHIIVTILVFLLAFRIIRSFNAALAAAFCFGLHPISTEPVNYISSRSESLAVMFCLACFYIHISAKSLKGYFSSFLLFGFALMVKSISCVLPFILVIYDFTSKNKRKNSWPLYVPYAVILILYLSTILTNGFLLKSMSGAPRGIFAQVFTQIKALVYYLYMIIMPVSLNIEHQFFVSESLFNLDVFICVMFLISLGVILFFVVKRQFYFWVIFGITFLLPTLIMPLNVLVNEHRLYMPLVAFSMGVGYTVNKRFRYQSLLYVGVQGIGTARLVILGLIFCSLVIQRNSSWKTEELLWNDSRIKSPGMVRPWVFWGIALGKSGNMNSAEIAYKTALKIDPHHKTARTNVAAIYLDRVKNETEDSRDWLGLAQVQLRNVLHRDPQYREALQNMGAMYFLKGDWAKADSFFTLCATNSPNYADCSYNAALTSEKLGQYNRAQSWIQRVIELEPNGQNWALLGRLNVRLDFLDEAIVAYRRALYYNGENIKYIYNLAEILLVLGQREIDFGNRKVGVDKWMNAKLLLEKIISLEPEHLNARKRLVQLAELYQ